jgi:arginine/ornithine N-succinyltransferase beta subunit
MMDPIELNDPKRSKNSSEKISLHGRGFARLPLADVFDAGPTYPDFQGVRQIRRAVRNREPGGPPTTSDREKVFMVYRATAVRRTHTTDTP